MRNFAVNVAILPPDPIMNLAIQWNRELLKTQPTNIKLSKSHYLPHISMAMGCLREDRLGPARSLLQSIADRCQVFEMNMPRMQTVKAKSGESIITFDILLNQELRALHESIVNAFKPLLTQDANEAAINDAPPIASDALEWINQYIPNQCFDKFWPHITVGFGEAFPNFQPITFQGSHLAICHLGNYCTCTTILAEAYLTP